MQEEVSRIVSRLAAIRDSRDSPLTSPAYECEKCKDTGYVEWTDENGLLMSRRCDCGLIDRQIQSRRIRFAAIPEKYREIKLTDFKMPYRKAEARQNAAKALAVVKEYLMNIEEYQSKNKGLYFYSGTRGSGKTMLMCGVCNFLMEHGHAVKFATSGQIINEIKSTWDKGSETTTSQLLEHLSTTEILAIDDFGAERASEWVDSVFYDIINQRYINGKVTLFTSNSPISGTAYDERIKNRVAVMTYEVQFPEESIRGYMAEADNKSMIEKILGGQG